MRVSHQVIWSCLARRKKSWMSYSIVKPTPPQTCCAIAVRSRYVWHAKSLAIGARLSTERPVARAQAAFAVFVRELADREPVNLLVRDGEIGSLDEILRHVRGMLPALGDDANILVSSAHELSDGEREKLERKLRADHGEEVRIGYETDPELLGGLRIRVGDQVIDRSIAAKLEAMRQRLVS